MTNAERRERRRVILDELEAEARYIMWKEQEADHAYRFRFIPVSLTFWQRFLRWIKS